MIGRVYWWIARAVAIAWASSWVAAVVGPTAGVRMLGHTYHEPLDTILFTMIPFGFLVLIVQDLLRGLPPWAVLFPEKFGIPAHPLLRKEPADSRAKP
jgi:hypothetical protein